MALADIIEAVAVHLAPVKVKLGAEHLATRDAPPRVVFVPYADDFAGGAKNATGTVKRSIATRMAGVRVHIWAAGTPAEPVLTRDLKACEALLDRVLWAVHREAVGSYQRQSVEWPDTPGAGHLGRLCVLRLAFAVPVTEADPDSTAATITTFGNAELTSTLDLPDPSADPTGSPAP
jgi:hypothetical protein